METASILISSLSKLLQYFQGERHYTNNAKYKNSKDLEEAMLSTHHAIVETSRYLELLQGKEIHAIQTARNRDTEYKLSELWAISAIRSSKFMDTSPDYNKAQEWLRGIKWEAWDVRNERLSALGISLDQMKDRLEATIKNNLDKNISGKRAP